MIKYNVVMSKEKQTYAATVELTDKGGPVQNNGEAIKLARALHEQSGVTGLEPVRVERLS